MQKQEFEERIERTVTDEQYKVIEEVYMWHPSIRNTSGKDEVAELYKSFGMTIFHDMLPRAKKAHELDELLRNAQREVQRIQEEIEELSCPTLQSLRRRSESFLPLPEALLKVRNRRTAYLQEQAHSRRRWSSLRAETLCRPLVCVRHVRSTWGLG